MEDLRNLVKSVRDKSFPYEKRDQGMASISTTGMVCWKAYLIESS